MELEDLRGFDVYSRLIKHRKIFLCEEIDKLNASIISALLLELDTEDPNTPIEFYINSIGGEVEGLFSIYDMMHFIKAPVKTICFGEACSAAAVLLSAGTKGYRYASPNSQIMIHQIQVGGIEGSGTSLQIEAKATKKLKNRLTDILARHTGNFYRKVYRDCEKDKFMSAKEALEYGIIDFVMPYAKEIPPLKVEKANNSAFDGGNET